MEEYHIRYNKHLNAQYIPDAHGLPLLTDAHLGHANDLSDWIIEPLGEGKHLVQAKDHCGGAEERFRGRDTLWGEGAGLNLPGQRPAALSSRAGRIRRRLESKLPGTPQRAGVKP